MFKKLSNISDYSVFDWFIFFFCFSQKQFFTSLIMLYSDCWIIFDFLVFFFPPPYTLLTRVRLLKPVAMLVLKTLIILSLTPPTVFFVGSEIYLINQSYRVVFANGFISSSSFFLKFTHITYRYIKWFKKYLFS